MSRHVVVRRIERADPSVIAGLGEPGVATVYEAQGRRGLLPADITPIQRGAHIVGSAVTVLSAPGDNLMVHAAVEVVRQGDVLVVALTQPAVHGMVGDLLATSLATRGCIGLVIDSAVRDSKDLNAMGFPVWSRAVHSAGSAKAAPGSVNVPVRIGDVTIDPGDVIVADDDGVVVVPRREATQVLDAARARLAKEAGVRARLEAGELSVDFYGLRDTLGQLGVEYVDDGGDLPS